jgi:hypothetical protein
MRWIVGVSVLLQLYYIYTCGIGWLVTSDMGVLFNRRAVDENLLDLLMITKVVAAPMSFALLIAKYEWGKKFTGVLFLVYGIGGYAMPFLAGHAHPMAWWTSSIGDGEGPVISIIWLALGFALTFPQLISRFDQWMSKISPPGA